MFQGCCRHINILYLYINECDWKWLRLRVIQNVFLLVYHYFYIYTKQRSKWNSGKINYNYLLNKIVVSHTSRRCNHGIYECITIWCVIELLRTSLLIAYLLRDLWDAIFIGYLSIAYLLVFSMPLLMPHGMWRINSCCSVVLSLLVSLVIGVMRHYTATKMRIL